MNLRRALLAFLLALPALAAHATEPLVTYNVILLQPDDVMKARVPEIDPFAAYIKTLQAQARQALPGPGRAASGFIVVAVRPGRQSKVWLDFDDPLNSGVSEALAKRLRDLPAPLVIGGPVVFALKVGIWGGSESSRVAPAPAEWRAAAAKAGRPLEPGELVQGIWND